MKVSWLRITQGARTAAVTTTTVATWVARRRMLTAGTTRTAAGTRTTAFRRSSERTSTRTPASAPTTPHRSTEVLPPAQAAAVNSPTVSGTAIVSDITDPSLAISVAETAARPAAIRPMLARPETRRPNSPVSRTVIPPQSAPASWKPVRVVIPSFRRPATNNG